MKIGDIVVFDNRRMVKVIPPPENPKYFGGKEPTPDGYFWVENIYRASVCELMSVERLDGAIKMGGGE